MTSTTSSVSRKTSTRARPASDEAQELAIEVVGARTHNLKGVRCRIPHGKLTVVTGPSGAGKSSLAFDTVFAEGQRRFVESMSTYARQFLQQMERPPVDSIDNILPPVALKANNSIRNARSTVGTITEVHDVLRLLYTHLGQVICPGTEEGEQHGPARRWVPEEVASGLAAGAAGERFLVVARVPRPKRKSREALAELIRQGFGRRLEEGKAVRMDPGSTWPKELDPLPLVLGRFRATGKVSLQLSSAVEEAYRLAGGRLEAVCDRPDTPGETGARFYSRGLCCVTCGRTFSRPTPPLFSFNSPLGACSKCQGFGRVVGVDPERVIPDPSRTLEERPIAPWNSPAYEDHYTPLLAASKAADIPLDVPWQDLDQEARDFVWHGPQGASKGKAASLAKAGFLTLDRFFAYLERKSYRVHLRVLLSRYRAYTPCPDCQGLRLKPEALAVQVEGKLLPELTSLSVEALAEWRAQRKWTKRQRATAGHLLEQLEERVEVLDRVGLGYLTLARQARTLSGGEAQRIHLATALGSGLTSTLYVLDEPTVGLHPVDSARLLSLLQDLAVRGNTVLVVEHDRTLIGGADHLVDLGPAAGERGGQVMAEGPPAQALAVEASVTGRYLRQSAAQARGDAPRRTKKELKAAPQVSIRGARAHNLKSIDVRFPLEALVAVTGVSGSGKSTLVENVLYGTYQRSRGVVDVEPGSADGLEGLDDLEDVTLVDQRPLGRSSRSNPVTYVKAYDDIRKLFAATPTARAAGITPAHFSFNLDRGRCPECKGTGITEVDMQFMAAVAVTCDRCQGHRFLPKVLAIRLNGRNISEVLEITVEKGLEVFMGQKRLCRRLQSLVDVGLGYLRLGQPTSTLSGGEAQRLKLASFLDRPKGEKPRLFLFDEPTTGLHVSDVDLLVRTLRRLVERGDGVVVVEHSSDLVAQADWVVDLGPGGGHRGGELLFAGPLDDFLK